MVTGVQTCALPILKKNSEERKQKIEQSDQKDQSQSGHQVDHGIVLQGETILASCPVVLRSEHFTGGSLEEKPVTLLQSKKMYIVHLDLSSEGRSRFYQWSRGHHNESLLFILDGEIMTAARVGTVLDVSDWQVGPITDEDSAKKLIDFVNHKTK